jgi:hypothetical protein
VPSVRCDEYTTNTAEDPDDRAGCGSLLGHGVD